MLTLVWLLHALYITCCSSSHTKKFAVVHLSCSIQDFSVSCKTVWQNCCSCKNWHASVKHALASFSDRHDSWACAVSEFDFRQEQALQLQSLQCQRLSRLQPCLSKSLDCLQCPTHWLQFCDFQPTVQLRFKSLLFVCVNRKMMNHTSRSFMRHASLLSREILKASKTTSKQRGIQLQWSDYITK